MGILFLGSGFQPDGIDAVDMVASGHDDRLKPAHSKEVSPSLTTSQLPSVPASQPPSCTSCGQQVEQLWTRCDFVVRSESDHKIL
jgi:hypothetical protein